MTRNLAGTKTAVRNLVNDACSPVADHAHQHGEACGHLAVKHGDHVDYEHDGHLHRIHGNHVDECDQQPFADVKPESD